VTLYRLGCEETPDDKREYCRDPYCHEKIPHRIHRKIVVRPGRFQAIGQIFLFDFSGGKYRRGDSN